MIKQYGYYYSHLIQYFDMLGAYKWSQNIIQAWLSIYLTTVNPMVSGLATAWYYIICKTLMILYIDIIGTAKNL